MIVIAIFGLGVALFIPLLSSVWQVQGLIQCQCNLRQIYQAENLFRADKDTTAYATGVTWTGKLLPYLERQPGTFICPMADHGGLSAGAGSGGAAGGGSDLPLDGPVQITFDVYASTTFQTFLYTITLDSPMVRVTQVGPSSWQYDIDDRPSCLDFGDIICIVDYEGDVAQRITFLPPIYHVYRFNLCVNGEVVVHDIDQHIGEAFTLTPLGDGGDGGSMGTVVSSDYGLSRGSYEDQDGKPVPFPAPGLFFILDYPKSLADYRSAATLGDAPYWDKYFILDPDDWLRQYGDEGGDWQSFQALRHFGKANVLFCDGHIELLSAEELIPTCPSWQYTGTGGPSGSDLLQGAPLPSPVVVGPQPFATMSGPKPAPISTNVIRAPVSQPAAQGPGQDRSVTLTAQVAAKAAAPMVIAAKPATAVTFHWNCADAADVYLNGAPLRKLPLDFRVRPAEGQTEFSAKAVIRRGDVLTIGARRGEACGFLLVAVDRDNKVVWHSDNTNWRAYFPGEKPWYVPAVAKACRSEAVSVQKPAPPLQEAVNRRFGGAAASIWHGTSQYVFLVSVFR
ncbi:MAG: hypothetical protein IMZ44_16155 [Planctomycetes bacterium]|nr:hypothetical protein [Planctomycetota bacterium]